MRRPALWLFIAIVALVYAGVKFQQARVRDVRHAERETVLRNELAAMRKALAMFRQDNGRYPYTLEELVPNYLRQVPRDPLTNAADWRLVTEEAVTPNTDFTTDTAAKPRAVIIDVQSNAGGKYSAY